MNHHRLVVLAGDGAAAVGPVLARNVDRLRAEVEQLGWTVRGQAAPVRVAEPRDRLRAGGPAVTHRPTPDLDTDRWWATRPVAWPVSPGHPGRSAESDPSGRRTVAEPPRILVTGWRDATPHRHGPIVRASLAPYWLRHGRDVTLVHGACHLGGVDEIAEHLALRWGWTVERHPAVGHPTQDFGPWPAAGPRRNAYMVSLGATVCEAFPRQGSAGRGGTWSCVHLAADAGIHTNVHPLPPHPATR